MQDVEPPRPPSGRLSWAAISALAVAHWTAISAWGLALNLMNGIPWKSEQIPGTLAGIAVTATISVGGYAVIRAGYGLSRRAWPWIAVGTALGGSALNALISPLLARYFAVLRPQASGLVLFAWETVFYLSPFVLWSLLVMVVEYGRLMRERDARLASAAVAAREAEIRALHYQVNPHFLYNALNSISTLILDGRPKDADRMVMGLAAFFRTNLSADPLTDVKLSAELEQQKLYLSLEEARYAGRLHVRIEASDEVADALVPTLILQPLIENAVKHGVHAPGRETRIEIVAARDGDAVVIRVSDDGPGSSTASGTGMGLQNVRRRLEARFPGQSQVRAGPEPTGGFAAVLRMPLVRDT
ncbi:MAG: hypothetical protein DI570_12855 [Phenylobacterium zucineum]|nr:MAG: hypothetical protein DI570_12855 [Phenylobacterium zucineum]